MSLLLDTNICIAFLNAGDAAVTTELVAKSPQDLVLCSVVKAELLFGARHSTKVDDNLKKLERFFAQFVSLPFDDAAAATYGLLREQLTRVGQPLGANDMLIAAICLTADATLVTRDEDAFRRVPGLRVEAW